MQAYEGYLENGQFYPIRENTRIIGRRKVIMTVLDDQKSDDTTETLSSMEYLAVLDELCGSIDDTTFVVPIEIPLEINAPREKII